MSKRMVDLKVADGKIVSINGYEVGGGGNSGGGTSGGGNIAVTSVEAIDKYKNDNTPVWNSGHALKANTSYAVGDQVEVRYTAMFNNISFSPNKIIIPYAISSSVSRERNKLQFGDVILVLTYFKTSVSSYFSNITNDGYLFQTENYLTYTVVKAGTTGDNVTLPSTGFNSVESYLECTIGPTEA